jgi:hypothetical protein
MIHRILLIALLGLIAQAQVLLEPDSAALFPEPPASLAEDFGSVGWGPGKSVNWLSYSAPAGTPAHLVLDADGSVIEPMDDFTSSGLAEYWQETDATGPAWPEDVWLRVVIGQPSSPLVRSFRFGFASSSASPLFIPEPAHALFAAVGLLVWMAVRGRRHGNPHTS